MDLDQELLWVIFRATKQRVTNLKLTTTELKHRCKEYHERIVADSLKDHENHVVHDDDIEPQLQDWGTYTEDNDQAFADELSGAILDSHFPAADVTFTPDTFGDIYLNKEIALPKEGADNLHAGRVTK